MFDRIFAPLLTFVMLIGGSGAILSALFFEPRPEAIVTQSVQPQVIELEKVIITGKRSTMKAVESKVATTEKTPSASQAAEGRGVLLHQPRD
ncbi:MAG: hypothetical protein H7Z15_21950 [Rhizobacter sp.]|nr:hypothetical protein [Rhizobacter sp.]